MNLSQILPGAFTYDENDLPIWSDKEKNRIIQKLSDVTEVRELGAWGNNNAVPTWFLLLRDDDLFQAFVESAHIASALDYLKSVQINEDFNQWMKYTEKKTPRPPLSNVYLCKDLAASPYFINYSAGKMKALKDKGLSVSYNMTSNLSSKPKYLSGLFKEHVLEFDEVKVMNSDFSFGYPKDNMSMLSVIIDLSASIHEFEKLVQTAHAIDCLLELGANSQCFNRHLITNKIVDTCDYREYMKKYSPELFKAYELSHLSQTLDNELCVQIDISQKKKIKI